MKTTLLPARYLDPQRIGHGGMGEIYRATDELLGRTVAVKVLAERYAGDEAVRERFTREALAAARLSGRPHIVTIFDVGDWQRKPYIVMEYLGGGTLEEHVRRGRVPVPRAVAWLEQAARALDAAHAEGVVHRDVKPANLLLDEDDNVHVADFGIANATGMDSLTKTGTVLGTAAYLSPEQAQGERATAASDRYGLAVVAWELLTGRRPFAGDTLAAEAAAHVHAPVPTLTEQRPDLPPELDAIFRTALAKDPAVRYPSAAEFVAAIAAALHAGAGTTEVIRPPLAREPADARRPTWLVPLIVGLGLAGAGLVAAALVAASGGGDESDATTVVTVTAEGRTQRVTVTEQAESPATPTAAPATSGLGVAQARALQDESTAALEAGDWERALALARQALAALEGRDRTYEAYANYNVGRSLVELGRCEEALPYLQRREQLAGPHPDVDEAMERCRG